MTAQSRVPSSSSSSSPHVHSPVPASPVPRPPSSATCPPARPVPPFAPLRVGRAGDRLRRAVRRRRRGAAAGLAVVAAVLAVGGTEARASRGSAPPAAQPPPAAVRLVSAPVRIADAATVRLLRPGDRVDVVAAERGGPPRVVAAGARVTQVPPAEQGVGDGGALVVLSVPRDTARALVGAGTVSRLAVTLC
ncbi:hypothetical protein [Streptomyces sp. TBY4]|uniref:hypothetical protein n=1 Tax=Streptomyces sp. TBY4 TaxID=2962030 RepID=UPI0020B8666E|nr:hypothetical protein [Streptomyces sp. TBY4]MCP3758775.1 hypothetical protein [Streptomyces sp. TBY4]